MASQLLRYVDPDAPGPSHDGTSWNNAYLSLSACLTAEKKNLVTADQYFTAACQSSSATPDNVYYAASGWTTDATHYVEVVGYDFPADGIWDDSGYVLLNDNKANDGIFWCNNAGYFKFRNIQIKVIVPAGALRYGIRCANSGAHIDLDSCIFKGDCTGTGEGYGLAVWLGVSDPTVRVWNCVGYGFISQSNPSDSNFAAFFSADGVVEYCNCTAYGNFRGFTAGASATRLSCINCASGNNTDDFSSGAGTTTIDHCCSDDGDGTNAQTPRDGDWANEFTDAANGDFSLIVGGHCIARGTDDPGSGLYDDDITGKLRSSTWDIGAFEGPPGMVVTIVTGAEVSMVLTAVSFAPMLGRWTWPVRERIAFNTEINASHDRTEQRIAKRRGVAAQYFGTRILLRGEEACAQFDAVLHGWLRKPWRVPLWHEAEWHDVPIPAGSSAIAVDTRYADFRDAGYAVIWQSQGLNEVVITQAVAADGLTLQNGTIHSYDGPHWVMPCRAGRVIEAANPRRYHGGALVDMTWRVEDVQAVTGFTAQMTYDGYTVLTDPAILSGDSAQRQCDPDVAIQESGNGPFEVVSNSDFGEVRQPHGWRPWTKAAAWWLRQLLYDLHGRQKAVLVPTFKEDLELTRPLGAGETSLYVRHGGFTRNMGFNDMRTYVAFRPAGSDIIPRKVNGISVISAAEELISINAAPGQAFELGTALCWVDRCRLADDVIDLTWHGIGKLETETPLVRVTS